MEARAKAISERTRDKSPQPFNRHRREISTDNRRESGRFPVVASPTVATAPRSGAATGGNRNSLEVPGNENDSVSENTTTSPPRIAASSAINGTNTTYESPTQITSETSATSGPGPHIPPPPVDDSPGTTDAEKEGSKDGKPGSLKRSTAGSGGARSSRRPGAKQGSVSSIGSLNRRTNAGEAAGGADGATAAGGRSRGVTLEDKPMDE